MADLKTNLLGFVMNSPVIGASGSRVGSVVVLS